MMMSVLGAAVAACSSEGPVDIGDDIGDEKGKDLGQSLADYAGNWDGYAEAYLFTGGSDRVRLTLDAIGSGTLRFGDTPFLDPPTDPNVGYPPNVEQFGLQHLSVATLYPTQDARVERGRIRLSAHSLELHRRWCQMQTPIPADDKMSYGCLPNWPTTGGSNDFCYMVDPVSLERVSFDCGKMHLCHYNRVCQCTESGCDLQDEYPDIQLDAVLEDAATALIGTLNLIGQRVTIRLERE